MPIAVAQKNGLRAVLFIAPAFPPLNSSGTERAYQFARRLPDYGWLPIVVTLDWARDPLGNPLDSTPLDVFPANTPVYRIPFLNPGVRFGRWLHRRNGRNSPAVRTRSEMTLDGPEAPRRHHFLYRVARKAYHFSLAPVGDEHFYWSLRARRECAEIARQHAVQAIFVSVSPWTAGLLGLNLQRRLELPLIVDFRDYWTQWAVRDGPRWRDRLDRYYEHEILRRADEIICTHAAMARDFLVMEPSLEGRCHVVTNGFDAAQFDWEDAATTTTRPHPGRRPLLVHAGTAWGEAAEPLIEAAARFQDRLRELNLEIRLVGGLSESCGRHLTANRLEDFVKVLPRVPHAAALAEMRDADGLLLLLVNNEGGRKWYPGKTFEYLAARKPIITIAPEGIATRLVRELGAGVTLDPSDIAEIGRTLVSFAEGPEGFRSRNFSLRDETLRPYERGRLTAQLAEILNLSLPRNHEA